jgi:hypothetical protein
MALNKATLKAELQAGLITILSNPQTTSNVNTIAEQMATLLSDKIDDYVKTGNAVGTDSGGDGHNLTIV